MNSETYQPVNLDEHPEFQPSLLHDKDLLMIPSQGEHNTRILVGQEGEMLYEQRQAGEVTKPEPGIFVSRAPLPEAEAMYLQRLFGEQNPLWKIPTQSEPGVPLDQIVLADPALLHDLGELAVDCSAQLYGFSQTPEMAELAALLDVGYYGNPDFAEWAGTKIGLTEFAAECGVQVPATVPIYTASELSDAAKILAAAGYVEAVVKVSHSTGAMGQRTLLLSEVLKAADKGPLDAFLPEEFMPSEGAVVQGWIPGGEAVSLSTFVEFDGSYSFTGAQMQLLDAETPPGSSGAIPIDEQYLEQVLAVGRKIAAGYVRHQAYGPHAMDMIIPSPMACEQLGLTPGEPLCHDENSRSSATMVARAWKLAITEGRLGVGWKDARIKLSAGTKIAQVITALEVSGLLLTEVGPEAEGVFVYNGAVLDSGHGRTCCVLAVSSKGGPDAAGALLDKAAICLSGEVEGGTE